MQKVFSDANKFKNIKKKMNLRHVCLCCDASQRAMMFVNRYLHQFRKCHQKIHWVVVCRPSLMVQLLYRHSYHVDVV